MGKPTKRFFAGDAPGWEASSLIVDRCLVRIVAARYEVRAPDSARALSDSGRDVVKLVGLKGVSANGYLDADSLNRFGT